MLQSGIQESNGGVARYYRADLQRNHAVSIEITGYAASAFAYLHALTGEQAYLAAAVRSARFLARTAWDPGGRILPFELDPPAYSYFFDCGIVVRGLLAVWRAARDGEFLEAAVRIGESMALHFAPVNGEIHPILQLPGKTPALRDALRWSTCPGCYQLKSAMAWWDLAEATREFRFREPYERALESALATYGGFLPGQPDPLKVMDRLHPFLYFLEGLLPRAADKRCATAICGGIPRAAAFLREIAPRFVRSDVYAQLLRIRLLADRAGIAPLDRDAAEYEAGQAARFQAVSADPRVHGGFYFGRKGEDWLPYVNPVSTAFCLQALAMWGHGGGTAFSLSDLI